METKHMSWRDLVGVPADKFNAECVHAVMNDGSAQGKSGLRDQATLGGSFDRVTAIAADIVLNGFREELGLVVLREQDGALSIVDGWHRAQAIIEAGQELARQGEELNVPVRQGVMSDIDVVEFIGASLNHRDMTKGERASSVAKLAKASGLTDKQAAERWGIAPATLANARLIRTETPVLYRCMEQGRIELTNANQVRFTGLGKLLERKLYMVEGADLPTEDLLKQLSAVAKRIAREAGKSVVGADVVRKAIAKLVRDSVKDGEKIPTRECLKRIRTELNQFKVSREQAAELAGDEESTDAQVESNRVKLSDEDRREVREAQNALFRIVCGASMDGSGEDRDQAEGEQIGEYAKAQQEQAKAKLGRVSDEDLVTRLKSAMRIVDRLEAYRTPEVLDRVIRDAQQEAADIRTEQERRIKVAKEEAKQAETSEAA